MVTCTASFEAWSSEVQTKGDHARHIYSWPWFLFVASFIFPLTAIERMVGYLEGELIPRCLGVLIRPWIVHWKKFCTQMSSMLSCKCQS
jgi:hypothetical protein